MEMQGRFLKSCILLTFFLVTSRIRAEDFSTSQIIDEMIKARTVLVTDKEEDIIQQEKARFEDLEADIKSSLFSLYCIIKNIEKYREKPSKEYLDIANKEKYNNLLQAMAGFIKGKEKKNKIIDRNAIDSLDIIRTGNFIDKICLYFDLDKLAEDKKTLGDEEAIRRYTEDISLDKLFFLAKILNYRRDNRAIVENRKVLELLCEDGDTLEALFQNLQEMKEAKDFLLLFNEQISFINQCGFSDLEFADCLGYFSYADKNMEKIIEYDQDTSISSFQSVNLVENRRKKEKKYTYNSYLDLVNPFALISWYFRKNKILHNFFDVLHLKHLLFGFLFCLFAYVVKTKWSNASHVSSIIYHIVLATTIFNFVFKFFRSIKYPFVFALFIAVILSIIKEETCLIVSIAIFLIRYLFNFFGLNYKSDIEEIEKRFKKDEKANKNDIKDRLDEENKKQQPPQPQHHVNLPVQQVQNISISTVIVGFLNTAIIGIVSSLCWLGVLAWNVGKFLLQYKLPICITIIASIVIYLIYKISLLDYYYNSTLHEYLCKKLKERTLKNAREFVKNMRSFYNTIRANTSLYEKLQKKLRSCYLLFDENASKNLTKNQKFILKMLLKKSENEITDEKIVKFFCLFDEEQKNLFRKAISEIYDVSIYVNSARLVSTKKYCIARFIKGDSNYICMKAMLHPYLTEGIKNNVVIGEKSKYKYRNFLFTGSNRSGKTTFIAAVALNVLLAHVFGIAFCDECILTPFDKIITIFNYETDINDQQSKFSNEIKVLESLLSFLADNKKLKILFASDEQFSSTDPETANYLMSCFIASIYLQKNITSLNSTHLALPRKLALLYQDLLGVCNVSLKTVIEEDGKINFKRTLLRRNGIMIGEQLAKNMGFFKNLDPTFVKILKNIKYYN